jgi:glycosyltransferase involved in cell wall biosynthesis
MESSAQTGATDVERPLVSVITPVRNRVDTIRLCLDSVARQSYQPIEHIVVDGASTDGTVELLSDYRTSHGFHWVSEPDSGMYDAINKGISFAHGGVLAYLNSDDLYFPWTVDVAVSALRRGADLIYGDLGVYVVEMNDRPNAFYIQFYRDFDLRYFSFAGTIGQPTVFWRRDVTDEIGRFDTRYRLIADCEYWLRAALSGATVRHVAEVMAVQVEHESTLRKMQATRLSEEFRTLRRAMMRVIEPPASPEWELLKGRVGSRLRQLEFFYEVRATRSPHKWSRFITMLHAHGIDVRWGDVRQRLSPARWRKGTSLFADPAGVYEVMGGTTRL